MKQGWEIKKLGEVCDVVGGSTPKTSEKTYWGGEHYWISPAELDGSKYVYATSRTITDEGVKSAHLQMLPIGTVLLSSRAPIGKVAITKVPMYCNQGFKNLICKNEVINEYVYWFLLNSTDYLNSLGTGATFKEISKKVVEQIQIPVPPLPEQEKIVAELDCLSGIIEKKKQQLKEYDALTQSIFYEMFGNVNEFIPLSYYIDSLSAGKSLAGEDECPNKVLKTGAVTYDYFDGRQVKNLPLEYTPIENHKVKVKDVLISRMNTAELVGACAYVWNIDDSTYLPDRLWRAEIRDNSNPIYLWKAIITDKAKEQIRNYASGTSGSMKNISKSSFLKVQIPKVSLSEQQEFASKIEAIEKQKELIKQSIAETETLFNSRMDYYFN